MPNEMLPNAPCVEVCESAPTSTMPGWLRSELGSGDVEDALPIVAPTEPGDFVFVGVADQKLDHIAYFRIGNAGDAARAGLRIGRDVVIGKRKDLVRMRDRQATLVQSVECVARAFVDQAAIDIEQRLVFLLRDDVTVPNLVEQRLHLIHCSNVHGLRLKPTGSIG